MIDIDDIEALTDRPVGVVYGGETEERPVSLETGRALAEALREFGFGRVQEYDIPADIDALVADELAAVLLALHGGVGEDGTLQGFLEMHEIPYTGSGVAASALAMDKWRSKAVFRQAGLDVPAGMELTAGNVADWPSGRPTEGWSRWLSERGLGPPSVVKPVDDGSSVDISMADTAERVGEIIDGLLREGERDRVLIEERVEGAEYTVGLFNGESLGALEVEPAEAFYDYTAKYESSGTEYVPIEAGRLLDELEEAGRRAFEAVGCSGVARVDFIGRPEGQADRLPELVCLEVNTIPGMTETSLVPKLAARQGIEFPKFAGAMLAHAGLRSRLRGKERLETEPTQE